MFKLSNLIILIFTLTICIGLFGCSKSNNNVLENNTIEQVEDSNITTSKDSTYIKSNDETSTIQQDQENNTSLENSTSAESNNQISTNDQPKSSNNSIPQLRDDAYTSGVSKNTFIGENFTIEEVEKMTKAAIGELTPFEVKFVYDPNIDDEKDVIYIDNENAFKYNSHENYALMDYMCYLCFRSGQHVVYNDGDYGRVTFGPEYPFNRLKYGADNANLGNELLISLLIEHNALNKAIFGIYSYGEAESKVCHYYEIFVPYSISESEYKSIVNDVIKKSEEIFPNEAYKVTVSTEKSSNADILYEQDNIYVPNYD